jgi:signal transduction histidine kinase
MEQPISKKIALLNQTTLDSLVERDLLKIIQHFTEIGLQILEADFGFAWWTIPEKTKYHLIYKSSNTPYEPKPPRHGGGNYEAKKTKIPFFVESAIKENYEDGSEVSHHMKSYVIIPITYANNIYGSIVICFKDQHTFSEVDHQLSVSLGNAAAQTITIHGLIEKEHQNVLTSARLEAALEEERIQNEFISNATHEIRTPLAIIRGNADLELMKKNLPASTKVALEIIEHEVDHLSAIISDLAVLVPKESVSKNKKDKDLFTKVELKEVIDIVVRRCATLANKKKIRIKTSQASGLIVRGDKTQLERLFLNLVRNSVTYGKSGGWIKVETMKSGGQAVVKVSDNGIGISEEDLPRIFDRFFKVDKSREREEDSTGLGLAIVKLITKAHRGTVAVESVLGEGSCFTVLIPLSI